MSQDDFRRYENFCITALARREHTRAELASKADKTIAPEIITAVLDKLAEAGYQSDARFCHSYVRSKAAKGDGGIKIRHALKQKGVSDALIRDAMDSVDWSAVAAATYCKKYSAPVSTPAERAKRQRFMVQRGFSFEEIKHAERAAQQQAD